MRVAAQHDDGSCYYHDSYNVLLYGGAKNYLGHDKTAEHNLYLFPVTRNDNRRICVCIPPKMSRDGVWTGRQAGHMELVHHG